jgi:hypothetical protein
VNPPLWLTTTPENAGASTLGEIDTTASHGLLLTVRVRIAGTVGLARLYLTSDMLSALTSSQNPLLRLTQEAHTLREKLTLLKRIVSEVPLHLLIGETELAAGDLALLEEGDVVVVERADVRWQEERISGNVRVRVGDGRNVIITGRWAEVPGGAAGPEEN